ncbi:hypothetical protein Tco_1307039, partial [Tanacetum coccineum]
YYVTHPSSVNDFVSETQSYEFQRDVSNDDPTDNLTTSMILLAKAITHHYSTPTNNYLHDSSNTRNQVYVQDGRVNVRSKNVGNTGRNMGRIVGNSGNAAFGQPTNGNNATVQRVPRTSATSGNTSTVKCYNYNEKVKKDEARITLTKEENDFLLAEVDGEKELKELNASCIMMVRIQTVDKNSDAELSYDSDLANEVHDSQMSFINDIFSKSDHAQYMEGNSGNDEQDNNVHDQKNAEFVLLIRNVQLEAEKTNKAIKDVKEENALLQKELEKYKEQVRVLETKPENKYDYMKAYNEA